MLDVQQNTIISEAIQYPFSFEVFNNIQFFLIFMKSFIDAGAFMLYEFMHHRSPPQIVNLFPVYHFIT